MGSAKPSGGNVRGVDKPCSMDRRAISITSSRYTPGAVMTERTSNGFTPHVIANDTDKASWPVNRLERHAGKLARAVLRGGGDGDTASLPDRPLVPRSRFRQRLIPGVGHKGDCDVCLCVLHACASTDSCQRLFAAHNKR